MSAVSVGSEFSGKKGASDLIFWNEEIFGEGGRVPDLKKREGKEAR